ncbi:hypothetical protein GJV85_12910 [Sulfurimonas aquatica]|uniref:DsrE family protein n=1 Tax=Sulfurimonas aquatica TaxID=2672570 RepID=A0A975GE28_9BACT|nr:DsrE family protein [Sulfurimonas aquatica]QSZ42969.1 hypothetical protein GJV85_12910 [Sulfurimonas aquatica]
MNNIRLICLILILFLSNVNASEYKSVFDCSSSDAQYIASRISLIDKTIDMIENDGDSIKVALTLHGACVAMVSSSYEDITADEDLKYIQKAQERLISLSKRKNVEIVACAMSLNANAIEKEEVLPFIHISKNSFIDTIKYQNHGYALMTFK